MRQQVKWLAFALAVMLVAQLIGPLRDSADGGPASGPLVTAFDTVSAAVPLAVVPAVVTLEILKYRLYEIDVIINRTVKYGLLSVALIAVYVAIVVGIGTLAGYVGGPVLTVAAAVVIAVLFQPRTGTGPSCWRTAWSTDGGRRRTRCLTTSRRTSPASRTPPRRWTG